MGAIARPHNHQPISPQCENKIRNSTVLFTTLQRAQLTFSRILFDAVAWWHRLGRSWRDEGLRELLLRGDSAFNWASVFKALLWTQVDFYGAILAL